MFAKALPTVLACFGGACLCLRFLLQDVHLFIMETCFSIVGESFFTVRMLAGHSLRRVPAPNMNFQRSFVPEVIPTMVTYVVTFVDFQVHFPYVPVQIAFQSKAYTTLGTQKGLFITLLPFVVFDRIIRMLTGFCDRVFQPSVISLNLWVNCIPF